jgi:hypothetical protein
MPINNNILNQKGTPAFYSDIFANRPTYGYAGRVFISTDTGAIYEDTGTSWTLIADAVAGTTGTLQQVTTNGNTTTLGIQVQGININSGAGTGTSNVAIGSGLQNNTTGSANTSLGLNSLTANTTANNNTAIGYNSGSAITTGSNNTIIGAYAGTTTLASNIVLSDGNANVRLYSNSAGLIGINQAVGTPSAQLDIHTTATYGLGVNGTGTSNAYLGFANAGTFKWRIGNTYNAGANSLDFYNVGTSSNALSINSTSNVVTLNSYPLIDGGSVLIKLGSNTNANGYTGIGAVATGLTINLGAAGTTGSLLFNSSANYSYTFPAATGTLALTSDLSSYLPLAGGTLTGALSGTSITASSLIKSGGTSAQILAANGSVITAGTNITISGGTIASSGGGSMAIGGSITSATAGSVLFAGTSGVLAQDNANFFWDNTSKYLGIGGTPTQQLEIITASAAGTMRINNGTTNCFYALAFAAGNYATGSSAGDAVIRASGLSISTTNGSSVQVKVFSTGNVAIGSTTDDATNKLQVSGSGKFTGAVAIGNTVTASVSSVVTNKVSVVIGGVQYYLLASTSAV